MTFLQPVLSGTGGLRRQGMCADGGRGGAFCGMSCGDRTKSRYRTVNDKEKKMRKTTLVAAGLVIGLSMGLAACGSKDTANQNTLKSTTAAVTTAESKTAAQAAGKEGAEVSSEVLQGEQGDTEVSGQEAPNPDTQPAEGEAGNEERAVVVSEPEAPVAEEAPQAPAEEASAPAPETPAQEEKQERSVEGTYTGSTDKYVDAMGSYIHYDVTLTLSGGSYQYAVSITVSGNQQYNSGENYDGSYTVNGDNISMTGKLESAKAYDGAMIVTGHLSSFAGSSDSITVYHQ